MRAIDAEELKRSIAVSALIEDQKTLEQIIDEQPTIEERKMGEEQETPCADCQEWDCYGCKAKEEHG